MAFAGNQDIGQEPVCLAPGGEDLVRRGVAQDRLDRTQQSFPDMRIMFRQDLQSDMLLRNPLDRGGKRTQIVDIARISQDRAC